MNLGNLNKQPEGDASEAESESADAAKTEAADVAVFSSHPIERFRIGRFQFEKGTLTLSGEDATEFINLMEGASTRDQGLVKPIDPEAASRVAKSFLETKRARGVDTSDNRPDEQK